MPVGTTEVELWFERRRRGGPSDWDSRYGQNYTFDVCREGLPIPTRSVALRRESLIDLNKIRVVDDTATKEEAGRGMSVRTLLAVRALAGHPAAAADAWVDVHVFDASGELIHAGTVIFQRPERDADPSRSRQGQGIGNPPSSSARYANAASTPCWSRNTSPASRTRSHQLNSGRSA